MDQWLIHVNKRICHPSQKKTDVTMIAHILSRMLKEEKYYKNFVAMQKSLDTVSKAFWNSRDKFMITVSATIKEWLKMKKRNKCTCFEPQDGNATKREMPLKRQLLLHWLVWERWNRRSSWIGRWEERERRQAAGKRQLRWSNLGGRSRTWTSWWVSSKAKRWQNWWRAEKACNSGVERKWNR